jgi:transcriptional regulator with XRE-family HTH domain
MKTIDKLDVKEIRRKLGMNQSEFWSKIGVTQSGGSRYESGRAMPRPVQALLRLVHVEHVDIARLRRDDWEVIEYLKSKNPSMLRDLKKEAKSRTKSSR